MSKTTNEHLELPDIDGPTETRTAKITPEALVKMVDNGGAEFCLNIIREFKGTGEMDWLVKETERRMLEICAERLGNSNTSEEAVEWFRDYHGLNDEEAEGSE